MAITGGSELDALWREANYDDHVSWIESLTDLRSRLNGTVEAAPKEEAAPKSDAPVAAAPGRDAQIEDLRMAISGLEADIQVLRQEMAENFAKIARRIEGRAP